MDTMEDVEDDERPSIKLTACGLDVKELCTELGTEFEIDDAELNNIDEVDFHQYDPADVYRYYKEEILAVADDDEEEDEENDISHFDKISRKMNNLTVDAGIKKQVMREGVGEIVPPSSYATVHYNVYLDGAEEPYDSTRLRGAPLSFDLDRGEVLDALAIPVASMRKKELSRFLVDARYGFKSFGCGPRIPGNERSMYVIELLNFCSSGATDYFALPKSERSTAPFELVKAAVTKLKKDAKASFKRKNFAPACKFYRQAANILEDYHLNNDEEEQEQQAMLRQLYCNLCVSHLRLPDASNSVIKFANDCLHIDPACVEAMFFKAKAFRMKGEFERARVEIAKVQNLKPGNREIAAELQLLESKAKLFQQMNTSMYKRMFQPKDSQQSGKLVSHFSGCQIRSNSNSCHSPEYVTGLVNISTVTNFQMVSHLIYKLPDAAFSGCSTGAVLTDASGSGADAYKCSAETKKMFIDRLEAFSEDGSLTEVPFSGSNFDQHELICLKEIAEKMGFHFQQRTLVGHQQYQKLTIREILHYSATSFNH